MVKYLITNRKYRLREIAGEYYLISIGDEVERRPEPIQMTETAAWIWEQIEDGAPPTRLPEKMTAEYEVDLLQAQVSVRQFLAELLRQGLIEAAEL